MYTCAAVSQEMKALCKSVNKATVHGDPGAGDREKILKTHHEMKSQNL